MAEKDCGHEKTIGGKFLWRCIRAQHKDEPLDKDHHVYEVVREIKEKTPKKGKS